jgi:hypothetical protein
MKTWPKWQHLLPVAISAFAFCFSCTDPLPDMDPEGGGGTDTPEETPEEADKFLNALLFSNGSKISGAVPAVTNTSAIRTNVKDTLYLMEGAKIPIRFSHPEGQPVAGIFIAVNDGTFYYDVPVEHEEESDTVSIIFIDIDPDELELPYDAPAEIIPYDANDQPLDIVERIITVEEPSGPGCDITVDRPGTLTDSTGLWAPEWYWHHTVVYNSAGEATFINAPGYAHITLTAYEGCCDHDDNKNCNILSTTLNATVNAKISYTIMSETFAFFTNGTFARQTHERKQNFDAENTQWCPEIPAYLNDDQVVTYQGTHDYTPGATSISYLTKYSNCDLCGYGSPGGALAFSCHLLVITRGSEGSKQVRVYVRDPTSEWYD